MFDTHHHVHHHYAVTTCTDEIIKSIFSQLKQIRMNQQELLDGLTSANVTIGKIFTESKATIAKLADLETAMSNSMQVTPEVQKAFEDLKAQLQLVDDLIPDQAPTGEGEATGGEVINDQGGDATGGEVIAGDEITDVATGGETFESAEGEAAGEGSPENSNTATS